MHKSTLWLIFVILCIYFALVLGQENSASFNATTSTEVQTVAVSVDSQEKRDLILSESRALEEEARTRRRHRHHLCKCYENKIHSDGKKFPRVVAKQRERCLEIES